MRSRQSAAFSGLAARPRAWVLETRTRFEGRKPQAAKFPPGLVGFPVGLAAFPSPLVVWISGCWICAGFHRATGFNFPLDLSSFRRTRSKFSVIVIVAEIFILLGFVLCFPPWSALLFWRCCWWWQVRSAVSSVTPSLNGEVRGCGWFD